MLIVVAWTFLAFENTPPTIWAQYEERVPMVKGRLDRRASTATGYVWLVRRKPVAASTRLIRVPPCRKKFERDSDYPKNSTL
jgi:hypothetical protein